MIDHFHRGEKKGIRSHEGGPLMVDPSEQISSKSLDPSRRDPRTSQGNKIYPGAKKNAVVSLIVGHRRQAMAKWITQRVNS